MRVLDLFCGGGGAADGYHQAGYEVWGVDIDPQPSYPHHFFRWDAMDFLQTFSLDAVDLIHASPPCQPYSKAVTSTDSHWNDTRGKNEPALIPALRELLVASGKPYVIENVPGAPLDGFILCGSMFGLDITRHRIFETSWTMLAPAHPQCHGLTKKAAERRGWEYRDMSVTGKGRRAGWSDRASELMGITRPMRQHDLKEAIPPAYTQWIGEQFLMQVERMRYATL